MIKLDEGPLEGDTIWRFSTDGFPAQASGRFIGPIFSNALTSGPNSSVGTEERPSNAAAAEISRLGADTEGRGEGEVGSVALRSDSGAKAAKSKAAAIASRPLGGGLRLGSPGGGGIGSCLIAIARKSSMMLECAERREALSIRERLSIKLPSDHFRSRHRVICPNIHTYKHRERFRLYITLIL